MKNSTSLLVGISTLVLSSIPASAAFTITTATVQNGALVVSGRSTTGTSVVSTSVHGAHHWRKQEFFVQRCLSAQRLHCRPDAGRGAANHVSRDCKLWPARPQTARRLERLGDLSPGRCRDLQWFELAGSLQPNAEYRQHPRSGWFGSVLGKIRLARASGCGRSMERMGRRVPLEQRYPMEQLARKAGRRAGETDPPAPRACRVIRARWARKARKAISVPLARKVRRAISVPRCTRPAGRYRCRRVPGYKALRVEIGAIRRRKVSLVYFDGNKGLPTSGSLGPCLLSPAGAKLRSAVAHDS